MATGLARQGFDLDLRYGKEREQAFLAAIGDCHFECKSDQKAKVTGHVFVETYQQFQGSDEWRPSGILVSTAGWWCIEVYEERWVLIRRTALKALARQGRKVFGGDGNRFRGCLVPLSWLIQPIKPI